MIVIVRVCDDNSTTSFAFKSFYFCPQVLDIILFFYSFSFKCICVNGISPPVCKENRTEQ